MKFVLSISSLVLAAAISSCVPYEEPPPLPPTAGDVGRNDRPPEDLAEATRRKAERERVRERNTSETNERETVERIPERMPDPKPPTTEVKPTYKVARPVPGRPGFVFSPYNNKLVNVEGLASGTLVEDPFDSKLRFRVP